MAGRRRAPTSTWPAGGGRLGALIRARDWAATPLGPVDAWPRSLRTAVEVCLGSAFPSFVWWGPRLLQVYNDAALPILRAKHPAALGAPARAVWADAWATAGPRVERVLRTGKSVLGTDLPVQPERGEPRETATFSFGALRDEAGQVAGLFITAVETTRLARAEQAPRATEARLLRLLDTDVVGILFFDRAGTIVDANAGFLRMTGYSREDVSGGALTWRTMTPPEWVAESEAQLERLAETGRLGPYRKEYLHKDGTRSWMLFAGRDLGDGTIVEFVIDTADRKELETDRERLLVAETMAAERQALLKRIVAAHEEERARISRDVHDGLAQVAHATALHLDNAVESLATEPARAVEDVVRAQDLARQVTREARRLIAGLRPETLDSRGLSGAVGQEVESLRAAGWPVEYEDGDLVGVRLGPEAEIALFRVAQEALSNVRKHTRHDRVRVRLKKSDGSVHLEVRDWGAGFDARAVRPGPAGERVGLTGMRERMQLVGGKLEVRSGAEHGTTVRATLPLDRA